MANKDIKLIITVPPFARFNDIAQDPTIESVRLNTTLSLDDPFETILRHVKTEAGNKDVWVDLKCRQLRISEYNVQFLREKEIHYVRLSHKIQVNTPTEIWVDNGNFIAEVEKVIDGDKLIVPSSTERKKGLPLTGQGKVGIRPGMAINILDPSLVIEGYLTDKDKKYVDAAKKQGMHNFMLSFVEKESDITDLLAIDPDAKIRAKIESKNGLDFVRNIYPKYRKLINLIAARGDGYIEVEKPDKIIDFCEQIIKYDPNAVFASRMFESLKNPQKMPKCQDLFDIYCGMLMGYKRFLIGDDICRNKVSVKSAIGLFDVLAEKYNKKNEKSLFYHRK